MKTKTLGQPELLSWCCRVSEALFHIQDLGFERHKDISQALTELCNSAPNVTQILKKRASAVAREVKRRRKRKR